MKRCSICKEELSYDNFGKSSTLKDGFRGQCKKCRKKTEPSRTEYLKIWRQNNRELKRELDKQYREKNKEKIKLYKKSKHYRAIKAVSDKKYATKINKNPILKLSSRIRASVSESLRGKKVNKTFDIIGYSSETLKKHLESNFKPGMSWDNYGRSGWHIDHIKPLVLFDKSEKGIREAWQLSNIQPLWESENCSKGSAYKGKRFFHKLDPETEKVITED